MLLSEIIRLVDGKLEGNGDAEILRVAKIEEARPGDITFLSNPKYKKYIATTEASAVLTSHDAVIGEEILSRRLPLQIVRVADPYYSFLRVLDTFHPGESEIAEGIHPTAIIGPDVTLGSAVRIGAHVVIGSRAAIGDGATLSHGCFIGRGASIGANSLLYTNVSIREHCHIGERCILHSGVVIGSDGFGFAPKGDGAYEKIPQRGIVVIGDDVEIGANCTVDRATIGETRIHRGVKIDNLVQVAHNAEIGEDTVIAAQTGISGSTKIGKRCMIGGQVGFVGHIEIADDTRIGAQSGVAKSITESGKLYFGSPAREGTRTFRIEHVLRQLPELAAEIHALQQKIELLESQLREQSSHVKS